ncbi:MAG: LysE family transporter [Alphaproteobacteria bacterium]|nr:LysE family transporter [Alphaproteobacteria bacterium]
MGPTETLAVLAGAHFLAAATPGPNNLLVMRLAMQSRPLAFAAAAGFWPAGVILSSLAMAGVAAVLLQFPWIERGLNLAGGAYLLWIGVKLLRASFAGESAAGDSALALTKWGAFRLGVFTNIFNPKSLAYYAGIFAALASPDLPLGFRIFAALAMPSVGSLWYATVCLALSSAPAQAGYRRLRRWIDRLAGAVMLGFGLRLIWQAR